MPLPHEDAQAAPFVPWSEFLPAFLARWKQGEHLSIIGQTQSGKSVFARELVEARTSASRSWHTVVLGTKPRDRTLSDYTQRGWERITQWPPRRLSQRVMLWPRHRAAGDLLAAQRSVFEAALAALYASGRWCVVIDETRYIGHHLGLARSLTVLWTQGASTGLTIVAATQRAAFVPLEFYSQARYLVLFRERSPRARKAVSDQCGGADAAQVSRITAHLERHECLIVDQYSGDLLRTRVDI